MTWHVPALRSAPWIFGALLACGDDGSGGSASDEGTGSATDGSGGSDGETGTGTGTGGSETDGSGSNESGETGSVECGPATCSGEQYCDWGANHCGGDSEEGTCEPRPEGCEEIYQPVCGCDGKVYSNACDAASMGVDVSAGGECEAPGGYFECGYRFCLLEFSYCRISTSDIGGEPTLYECPGLPDGCGDPPTCDCLAGELCYEFGCEDVPGGGLQIVCPGC